MKRIKPDSMQILEAIFQIVAASVPGAHHITSQKNNQDALSWSNALKAPIGVFVVSDGNGSQIHDAKHEVGSSIAVKIFEQQLLENSLKNARALKGGNFEEVLAKVILPSQRKLISIIDTLLGVMDSSNSRVIGGYFLFTLLGVIVTPSYSYFFRVGDGKFYVNGEEIPTPKFEGNIPPYPGYKLVHSEFDNSPELLEIQMDLVIPTLDVNSFTVGTDGVGDMAKAAGSSFPNGNFTLVHPANIHLEDDLFEGENLQIHLKGANTAYAKAAVMDHPTTGKPFPYLEKHPGLIGDDIALISVRREG